MTKTGRVRLASFFLAIILIAAVAAFFAVDVRTDLYMPGQFPPFFLIHGATERGLEFSFMGGDYLLSAEPFRAAEEFIKKYRAFLPVESRLAMFITQIMMENV